MASCFGAKQKSIWQLEGPSLTHPSLAGLALFLSSVDRQTMEGQPYVSEDPNRINRESKLHGTPGTTGTLSHPSTNEPYHYLVEFSLVG